MSPESAQKIAFADRLALYPWMVLCEGKEDNLDDGFTGSELDKFEDMYFGMSGFASTLTLSLPVVLLYLIGELSIIIRGRIAKIVEEDLLKICERRVFFF